jgi:hypothetical protein
LKEEKLWRLEARKDLEILALSQKALAELVALLLLYTQCRSSGGANVAFMLVLICIWGCTVFP